MVAVETYIYITLPSATSFPSPARTQHSALNPSIIVHYKTLGTYFSFNMLLTTTAILGLLSNLALSLPTLDIPTALVTRAVISTDGTCGGSSGFTCAGSSFGNCCSSSGFCGSTVAYCAQGCKSAFGTCLTGSVPSLTGECGATNGNYTCAGGPLDGQCCSTSGFW